jgi:hypothetical protein
MPEKKTIERARKAKRAGKSATTQAGEFVREQVHKIRRGAHGARSAKQAIAIGLSQARRAGVKLPPPEKGETSEKTRKSAERAYRAGQSESPKRKPSAKRSRATAKALKREGTAAASHTALSRQAKAAAKKRTAGERSAAAKKAARTKGPAKRKAAAKKAVRTKGRAGLVKAARKAARTRAASR